MNTDRRRFYYILVLFVIIPFGACSQVELDDEEIQVVVEEPVVIDRNGWDIPDNDGVRNALRNAEQLVYLSYTPKVDFFKVGGYFPAGTAINGLVYSSTRAEDLLVPNNVSLWTFMSAINNPNSYPYTIDISKPPYNIRGYAKPFYGQVCSSFIQYALGIKHNFQILQMTIWDGFDKIASQNIDEVKLGDIMITLKRHAIMITGIHRENNHVVELELSEGYIPCARAKIYPVKYALDLMDDGYELYRYRYIDSTKHSQSPFVCVGNETPFDVEDMPVDFMVPRRGDKANWRKDENVVVDVLSREGFTKYKLFKDDSLIEEKLIPENNVLDFGVMPYGKYRLCLANETEDSKSVYWIVADYSISAKAEGQKKVTISFSTMNTTPIWVTWRRPADDKSNYNDGPQWTTVIYENDSKNGYVISELNPLIEKYYGLGKWDFKVAFETEYGIITSDAVTVNVY